MEEVICIRTCEVCQEQKMDGDTCDHPKNGYCQLFRLQAIEDKFMVNMHKPKNPHFEEIRGKF